MFEAPSIKRLRTSAVPRGAALLPVRVALSDTGRIATSSHAAVVKAWSLSHNTTTSSQDLMNLR